METTTYIILGLIATIIVLTIALVFKGNKDSDQSTCLNKNNALRESNQTGLTLSNNTTIDFANVDELVLNNSLGQEIVFMRPSELSEKIYKEIEISGKGKIMQHAGQGAAPIIQKTYTMRQLKDQAKNGLFASTVPKESLHRYNSDKTFSSIVYNGNKIDSHHGFKEVELASVAGISPAAVCAIAMQGMAIISGQYYLKHIAINLNSLKRVIEEVKDIHESEARGILTNCRGRLQQIAQMNYCSEVELNEIRSLTNDARKIYEQYKDRYLAAYQQVQDFYFKGLSSESALKTYNEHISNMRYLLQVCMIADRVIDEALLTEFVTRRKININDPALEDIYNQMEKHYYEGFNARLCENYEKYFGNLQLKGERIRDAGMAENAFFGTEAKEEMLIPISKNLAGLKNDVDRITISTRHENEMIDEDREILMMIDEKNGAVRMFEPA